MVDQYFLHWFRNEQILFLLHLYIITNFTLWNKSNIAGHIIGNTYPQSQKMAYLTFSNFPLNLLWISLYFHDSFSLRTYYALGFDQQLEWVECWDSESWKKDLFARHLGEMSRDCKQAINSSSSASTSYGCKNQTYLSSHAAGISKSSNSISIFLAWSI